MNNIINYFAQPSINLLVAYFITNNNKPKKINIKFPKLTVNIKQYYWNKPVYVIPKINYTIKLFNE